MTQNDRAFRAVRAALHDGAAVGIFPEGTSHSEPGLVTLKTGAARIALSAATENGGAFPIVPIGLVLRKKDAFRSEAVVLTGRPVQWEDLAGRGDDDQEAVRLLTDRITSALKHVTVNLERWEDRPLVGCAVRMWEAERGIPSEPAERVARLDATTRVLAEIRRRGDERALSLANDVERFCRRLARLSLRPTDLVADVRLARGIRWSVRRLHLLFPFAALLAVIGLVLYWIPYRLTGLLVDRLRLEPDVRATWKLLLGTAIYVAWTAGLAVAIGARVGFMAGVIGFLTIPSIGMAGLVVRERWRHAWDDARRFFILRSRHGLVANLRERQRDLAERLETLYKEYSERSSQTVGR
jgi:hypothetical protein